MDEKSIDQRPGLNTLRFYGNLRRIKTIYQTIVGVVLAGLLVGIVILATHGDWLQVYFMIGTMLLVASCYRLVNQDRFELATIILALILFSMITLISTLGLGIHSITNLGFPAILILASLVIRKRTLALLFLFAVLCVAWLVFGELLNLYTPTVLVRSVPGDFFTVLVVLAATAFIVRLLTEALHRSQRDLQKELSVRKRAEERLAYDALHDALTGLPNRTLFYDRLVQRFEHARRHPEKTFAVMFIDLDRFKVINDSLGHAIGDNLLVETAQRLKKCLRMEDSIARLSGDEFAILLNEISEVGNAIHVAERIREELMSRSMIAGYNRATTASIGITIYNERYKEPIELLRDADSAMYRAKGRGGDQHAIFDDSMHASAMALLQLETDLKHAVENQEWQVYYQPVVTLPERTIVGLEALLRWDHPRRGTLRPDEFIHVAEETGLIVPIGEYVLREACYKVKAWREKIPGLTVSVNLSGRQFQQQELVDTVRELLAETGLPGEALQLEITESVAMRDLAYSARVLSELEQEHIQIALDDFGIGYSSFGYLHHFPIRILKIDRAFIRDLHKSQSSRTIIHAIISLAHTLGLQVIAEGVETEDQLELLNSLDCDLMQGNLVCRAVPADMLDRFL